MSMFRYQTTCEDVMFYSHHIDPVFANTDGVMSIANGHTSNASLPDQRFTIVVDASTNALSISSQLGSPAPSITYINLLPGGDIDISGNKIINVSTPENPNDVATKAYVDAAAGGGGGGGGVMAVTAVNKSTPSAIVNNTSSPVNVLTISPTGASSSSVFDFDVTSFSLNFSTASVNPVTVQFYLSDTVNGMPNTTGQSFGVIPLNISSASGAFQTSNIRLSWYGQLPTNLYFNALLTSNTQGANLTSIAVMGQVRSIPATLN